MLSTLLTTAENFPYIYPKAWASAASGYLSTTGSSALGVSGAALTLSMLVYFDTFAGDAFLLANNGNDFFLSFDNATKKVLFQVNNGAANVAGGVLMANAWYRVTGRLAGAGAGQLKIRQALIGGTSSEVTASGVTITHTSNGLTVGARGDASGPLTGRFCDVAVWDVALSDADVALLESGRRAHTVTTKPVGYWPMVYEGPGTREIDYSYNGNHVLTNPTILMTAGPKALDLWPTIPKTFVGDQSVTRASYI